MLIDDERNRTTTAIENLLIGDERNRVSSECPVSLHRGSSTLLCSGIDNVGVVGYNIWTVGVGSSYSIRTASEKSVNLDTLDTRREDMKKKEEKKAIEVAVVNLESGYESPHTEHVGWVLSTIVQELEEGALGRANEWLDSVGRDRYKMHCRSLISPRRRGSTTRKGLDFLPPKTPLKDVTRHYRQLGLAQEGCSYMEAEIPEGMRQEFGARLGVISLRKLMELEGQEPPLVQLRDAGSHGIDLVFQMHEDYADEYLVPTNIITIILGPKPEEMWEDTGVTQDHELITYTWHPGPVMSRGSKELTLDSMIKLEVIG